MQNSPGQEVELAKQKAERPGIGNTNTDFLLPWAILQYLHPRVRQRLDADRLRQKCLFDALIMKTQEQCSAMGKQAIPGLAMPHWAVVRRVR
jgi:hypothetical protein